MDMEEVVEQQGSPSSTSTLTDRISTLSEKLESIFEIHKESICAEIEAKFDRKPTVDEFWKYYVNQYIEPSGWYGVWKSFNWNAKQWPVPEVFKGYVQVLEYYSDTLTVKVTLFKTVMEEVGDSNEVIIVEDNIEDDSMNETVDEADTFIIPLWEIEPVRAVCGNLINIETLRETISMLRVYRINLCLPFNKEVSCDQWFMYGKKVALDLVHDLEHPGALTTKTRDEIISLISAIRPIEQELDVLEYKLTKIESELEEGEDFLDHATLDEVHRQVHLQIQLETFGNRLKYLSDIRLRVVVEAAELRKCMEESGATERHDIVVVITDEPTKLSFWDDIRLNIENITSQPDPEFKIVKNLDVALSICKLNGTIFVGPGDHSMTGLGSLEGGGQIIGVPVVGQGVTIATRGTGDVWMLVQGRVCFRNIVFVIEAGFSELSMKTAIHVLSGFLDIKECSFCNNGGVKFGLQKVWLESDYFIVGIEMNSSSQLRLADCKMCGFHIALKLHDTAKVSLEKAEIHDSHYGFEICGSGLEGELSNVKIQNVSNFLKTDIDDPSENLFPSEFIRNPEMPNVIQITSLTLPRAANQPLRDSEVAVEYAIKIKVEPASDDDSTTS